ncbi:MAG: Rrf2 family transcriptional regulator, partial [Planctomycetota bacterium]
HPRIRRQRHLKQPAFFGLCPLPTAHCRLPTARCPLPAAHFFPPTAPGMKLSAKTEYACLAMLQLAADQAESAAGWSVGGVGGAGGGPVGGSTRTAGRPTTLRSLSERQGIPEGFLVQILQDLRRAGLVTSTRGSAGGYRLARPAAEVSLADVRRAIEGEDTPAAPACGGPFAAALHTVCTQLQRAEHDRLAGLSLADVASGAAAPPEPMWYI